MRRTPVTSTTREERRTGNELKDLSGNGKAHSYPFLLATKSNVTFTSSFSFKVPPATETGLIPKLDCRTVNSPMARSWESLTVT